MLKLIIKLVVVLAVIAAIALALGGASPAESRSSLLEQFTQLTEQVSGDDVRAESVSGWSVHQHAEHVLLAAEGIVELIEAGEVPDDATSKSFLGWVVLRSGYIPRGRGEAPSSTVPGDLSAKTIRSRLEALTERVRALDAAALEGDPRILGNHPYFGGFTGAEWLRFVAIHGAHHGKIIAEVLAAESAA